MSARASAPVSFTLTIPAVGVSRPPGAMPVVEPVAAPLARSMEADVVPSLVTAVPAALNGSGLGKFASPSQDVASVTAALFIGSPPDGGDCEMPAETSVCADSLPVAVTAFACTDSTGETPVCPKRATEALVAAM